MDSAVVALPVPDDWALVEVLWWAAFRLYPVDINDPDHEYERSTPRHRQHGHSNHDSVDPPGALEVLVVQVAAQEPSRPRERTSAVEHPPIVEHE